MDETLSRWLQLREPADTVSRSKSLSRTIASAMPEKEPVHVLDLATGTGANLRYLSGFLPDRQHWLIVDNNAALLNEVPSITSSWALTQNLKLKKDRNSYLISGTKLKCHIKTLSLDLRKLDNVEIFKDRNLVTASALLDLTSEEWLRTLANRCRAVGAGVLFAITYTGSSICSPQEPEDDMILNLLNRHQKTDKGLGGLAEGPDATDCASRCFEKIGYSVQTAQSNWILGNNEQELQRMLIDNWTIAAIQMEPTKVSLISHWRFRRIQHINSGRSHIVVSHLDLAAWLPR